MNDTVLHNFVGGLLNGWNAPQALRRLLKKLAVKAIQKYPVEEAANWFYFFVAKGMNPASCNRSLRSVEEKCLVRIIKANFKLKKTSMYDGCLALREAIVSLPMPKWVYLMIETVYIEGSRDCSDWLAVKLAMSQIALAHQLLPEQKKLSLEVKIADLALTACSQRVRALAIKILPLPRWRMLMELITKKELDDPQSDYPLRAIAEKIDPDGSLSLLHQFGFRRQNVSLSGTRW